MEILTSALPAVTSLGPVLWREFSLIWNADDELHKLCRIFHKIQESMRDMESSPLRFSGGSEAWKLCFEKLRQLTYDAEALLGTVNMTLYECCNQDSIAQIQKNKNQVLSLFDKLSQIKEKIELTLEIKNMQEKLEELAKEMDGLVKSKLNSCKFPSTTSFEFGNFAPSPSYLESNSIIGRDQDKKKILNLLTEQSDNSNFSVVLLVGMAGVGKTAVARIVYDDEVSMRTFQKRIWVSASFGFDVVEIIRSIIESATGRPCNLTNIHSLQVKLREILCGTKFLLVIDDYWNERHADWDILCSPFKFGSKGSKIIVTTRSANVSIFNSYKKQELDVLSNADCWLLIEERVREVMKVTPKLESIGKKIAEKCKGLPIVAMSFANVLRRKSTDDYWRSILENDWWDVLDDCIVFNSLMLSYLHLPNHLKKCFVYCSIFPKDHEFDVEEMVLLWLAEGFIEPVKGRRLEDYFNDLHARSFFQQCEGTFKMHDFIHDMAQLISSDICSSVEYNMLGRCPLFGQTCHLSLFLNDTKSIELKAFLNDTKSIELKALTKNERLRTFLSMGMNPKVEKLDKKLFMKLRHLRVLGLSGVGLKELQESIDNLKYLRYLNLSNNPLQSLPKTICKLLALQILKLKECGNFKFPNGVVLPSNLQHLEVDKALQLPPNIGRLTSLQTLATYTILSSSGRNLAELKNMNCLSGSLCIENINEVSDAQHAKEANIGQKEYLNELQLKWIRMDESRDPGPTRQDKQHEVLEHLRPHDNLKKLFIENYDGTKCPSWFSELSMLTSIQLIGLKYCTKLPPLGQLPCLESFYILDMQNLKIIYNDFYGDKGFPALTSFKIEKMSNLQYWPESRTTDMPQLTRFKLLECEKLQTLPQKLQDRRLRSEITGCSLLQRLAPQ